MFMQESNGCFGVLHTHTLSYTAALRTIVQLTNKYYMMGGCCADSSSNEVQSRFMVSTVCASTYRLTLVRLGDGRI